eukprot:8334-Pyramimonas_sp.AAC.1
MKPKPIKGKGKGKTGDGKGKSKAGKGVGQQLADPLPRSDGSTWMEYGFNHCVEIPQVSIEDRGVTNPTFPGLWPRVRSFASILVGIFSWSLRVTIILVNASCSGRAALPAPCL